MSSRARIIATLTEPPDETRLAELSGRVDVLEVRADLLKSIGFEWLRGHFQGELLFTLRSREEGGESEAGQERRRRRLSEAARHYDLVDLEGLRDLHSGLLGAVPPAQRLVSWHGPPSSLGALRSTFSRLAEAPARYYKLVPAAEQPHHEMAPLALLHSQRRPDIIAFASGRAGAWTRLIAPRLGAPVVYGSVAETPAAAGQPSVDRLLGDYCLPELPPVKQLLGLVGADIKDSLSPRLHNRLIRQLGLPYLYLPFPVQSFGDFWLEVVEGGSFEELGFELSGLSVTAPHKGIASAVAGATSPLVEWLGSANTLVRSNGVWEAESTDGEGVRMPLEKRGRSVPGTAAAVVGAGGAGRAAVVALRDFGAEVTLVNRSSETGRKAAAELRVPFRQLEGFDPKPFELLVHATPLGKRPEDPLPLDPTRLAEDALVVDLVYLRSEPTRLVSEVRAAGRQAVDGREVLVYQAAPQFRLMTGRDMPIEEAFELVGLAQQGRPLDGSS